MNIYLSLPAIWYVVRWDLNLLDSQADIRFDTGICVIERYTLSTKTFNYQIPNTIDHQQDSSLTLKDFQYKPF
jgi:hypothetical protein